MNRTAKRANGYQLHPGQAQGGLCISRSLTVGLICLRENSINVHFYIRIQHTFPILSSLSTLKIEKRVSKKKEPRCIDKVTFVHHEGVDHDRSKNWSA